DSKGKELDPPRFKAYPDELLDCYISDTGMTTNCKTHEKLDLIIDNQGKILSRLDAILRQAYQLAEFTVPRFFIIMIEKKSRLNPDNLLHSTYRLFFLCECNKDEMHLAYHEGYIINQPREFFIKYGPYVKNMIYAFKAFGTVAGFILPNFAFAQQVAIPNILKDGAFWNDFADKMNTVDNVVNNVMAKPTDITMNPTCSQTYEGADLRQLEKFLEKTDDCRTLGNLHRTTTDEGHVRWVCIKHFNETYSKTRMEEFIRLFEAMGGEFHRQQDQAILKKAVNIKKFCELLSKGFNMYKLSFISHEMRENDFVTLLEAINRSFIKELELSNIKVSPLLGSTETSLNTIELIEKNLGTKQYLTVYLDIQKRDAMFNEPKFAQKLLTDHTNILIKIDNKPYTKQTTLDLGSNQIPADGAKAIATALMTNQTLTTLKLYNNQISADGAKAIATALITNQTLTTLDLGSNQISADGAKAIATALMTNQTLTTLDLDDNQISADGAKAIATAPMTNQTLTTLSLD
ncbi:unnamed protein product, partial [Didymodactylos carnosus]